MAIERKIDRRRLIIYWSIPIAYMAFIFFFSSRPAPEELPEFRFADKFYHVIEYGILSILLFRAFLISIPEKGLKALLFYSFLISTLYGITDEIHQYFVPERFATISDAVADGIGGILGAYIYMNAKCKSKNAKSCRIQDSSFK